MKSIIYTKRLITLMLSLTVVFSTQAQSSSDSIAIHHASWTTRAISQGVTHQQARFDHLFGGAQNINMIVMDGKSDKKIEVYVGNQRAYMSDIARKEGALAAINGTYYDVGKGETNCYYRKDRDVIHTTAQAETYRVTGAIRVKKGKMKIFSWNENTEKNYRKRKGTVLASGPLLIEKGRICSFSQQPGQGFYTTKHPRSAVGITKDKKIYLVTVDGRQPQHAIGANIYELAYLLKQLDCVYALNLDGGGSVTLWAATAPDNGVVNSPSSNGKFDNQGERTNVSVLMIR